MISKIGYNIMSQSCIQGGSNGFSILSHGLQLVVKLGFNDVVRCCNPFCLSYSSSLRFFTLESILFKSVSIGNFFVMDQSMYSAHKGSRPHFTPPIFFNSILRSRRQLFSQSLVHKNDRAEHGLSFSGNFSL